MVDKETGEIVIDKSGNVVKNSSSESRVKSKNFVILKDINELKKYISEKNININSPKKEITEVQNITKIETKDQEINVEQSLMDLKMENLEILIIPKIEKKEVILSIDQMAGFTLNSKMKTSEKLTMNQNLYNVSLDPQLQIPTKKNSIVKRKILIEQEQFNAKQEKTQNTPISRNYSNDIIMKENYSIKKIKKIVEPNSPIIFDNGKKENLSKSYSKEEFEILSRKSKISFKEVDFYRTNSSQSRKVIDLQKNSISIDRAPPTLNRSMSKSKSKSFIKEDTSLERSRHSLPSLNPLKTESSLKYMSPYQNNSQKSYHKPVNSAFINLSLSDFSPNSNIVFNNVNNLNNVKNVNNVNNIGNTNKQNLSYNTANTDVILRKDAELRQILIKEIEKMPSQILEPSNKKSNFTQGDTKNIERKENFKHLNLDQDQPTSPKSPVLLIAQQYNPLIQKNIKKEGFFEQLFKLLKITRLAHRYTLLSIYLIILFLYI